MYFETVSQTQTGIALNHFTEYTPDHIGLNLIQATQTNATYFILYIFGIPDFKPTNSLRGTSFTR
jgi:hypothetical protein